MSGKGGSGGSAEVYGENSNAEGGAGGDAVLGDGGKGGDARVDADNSQALGGPGGRGGIGNGGDGGDARIFRNQAEMEAALAALEAGEIKEGGGRGGGAYAVGENSLVAGGQGGEASQPDGRGGRGGRAHIPDDLLEVLGMKKRPHMKWPYFEPITEPGRGGDTPDTPQYMARRIILEQHKRAYFRERSLPLEEAWWDREIVPLDWLNEQLRSGGHRWQATVVDHEYEFSPI